MKHCIGFSLLFAAKLFAQEALIPSVPDKQPAPHVPSIPPAPPQMLLPGFTVRELPVKLTNINNVEYSADGRLFAGGYDGRFHVLRDTDGDGLEDHVDTFVRETSGDYPLGMTVKDGDLYAVLSGQVVRFRDTDADGIPDSRETVAGGFDDPELANAAYLNHRRVDNSMAIASGPDGALYITMGNAGPANPYWKDKKGVSHYSLEKRRGCLLRLGPGGQFEQLATGLRYIMSLQFNQHGDLFGTDQEGATWSPNGNPFDELLHLQKDRHYGFPPSHPQNLPGVIDEPSVWDFGPQHQSVCGFRFNGPGEGRGVFGPARWAGDAVVTGESRGKLWRTTLAKTAAGYIAATQLIGSSRGSLLPVDCAISPAGDLLVSFHSGIPDWGNGPNAQGKLYKISLTEKAAPQPVIAWPRSETETVIAFDRPLEPGLFNPIVNRVKMEFGRYVGAADRLETVSPSYAVVSMQKRQPRRDLAVESAALSEDRRNLLLKTAPRRDALNYSISLPSHSELAHDLSGVQATWQPTAGKAPEWSGWLPHPDFTAARHFTRDSAEHEGFWAKLTTPGTAVLRGRLDLWRMLIPATQPLSQLDYTPGPETVSVLFKSDAPLVLECAAGSVERISDRESRLTVAGTKENVWPNFSLTLATPARSLDVSASTARDPRPRAVASRRFLVPYAQPGAPDNLSRVIPEIAGGNWEAGKALFTGKAACATCHTLRGEGVRVGPDLTNQTHRNYAAVLKDIAEPSATINPDAIGYTLTLRDGSVVTGTLLNESAQNLEIAQPGGAVAKLAKSAIKKSEALPVSLMPAGLDKSLSKEELRDLMTYLLLEKSPTGGAPAVKTPGATR